MSAGRTSVLAPGLPTVGAAVDLVLDGQLLAARCEGVDGTEVEVSVRGGRPARGARVELRWHGTGGISRTHGEIRTARVAVDPATGPVTRRTSWRLRVMLSGAIDVVQPRTATRAQDTCPVAVTTTDRRLAPVRTGSLLDIAEVGLRCRLAGPPLTVSAPVSIHVGLADEVLELQGRVNRVTVHRDGYAEVVLTFDPDEADGARIRRFVYLQQMRLRRAGLV